MVERVKKNSRVAVVWSSVEGLVTLVWRGVRTDKMHWQGPGFGKLLLGCRGLRVGS